MVEAENRALSFAVAGSVVAHLVVFALAALYTAFPIFALIPDDKTVSAGSSDEDIMRIILPDLEVSPPVPIPDEEGLIPVPEVSLPDPETEEERQRNYIRTTQNDGESAAPERSEFVSDRNTSGASELPPDPDATDAVPTQDGVENLPGIELKDREYRDGEIKDDSALPSPETIASAPAPPANPNPLHAEPQKPEDPAELGERNDATDPDALGPDLKTPPEFPGEGDSPEGPETEAPDVSIEPADPAEMSAENAEVTPNPLEAEVAPKAVPASIPPPADFEDLLGTDDIVPLPMHTNVPPTPEAAEHIDPAVTPSPTPLNTASAAPIPQIRRPETIMPADPVLPRPPSEPSTPSIPLPGDPNADTADAFQPHTRKRKMSGTLSNRGPAAVDAEATPLGRYTRQVTGDIERRWNILRSQKADYVTYGNLRIRFDVDKNGRTKNVRILSSDVNPIMADFTLRAINGAEAGPMPPDVIRELALADGLLEITYNVIIY